MTYVKRLIFQIQTFSIFCITMMDATMVILEGRGTKNDNLKTIGTRRPAGHENQTFILSKFFIYIDHGTCIRPSSARVINSRCDHVTPADSLPPCKATRTKEASRLLTGALTFYLKSCLGRSANLGSFGHSLFPLSFQFKKCCYCSSINIDEKVQMIKNRKNFASGIC
jgi:hypothetical protein